MDMREHLMGYLEKVTPTPTSDLSVSLYRVYGVRDIYGCADWYFDSEGLERRGMAILPNDQTYTLHKAGELIEELTDVITDLFADGHRATLLVIREGESETASLISNMTFRRATVTEGFKLLLDGDSQ